MPKKIPVPGNISESSNGAGALVVYRWNRGTGGNLFLAALWIFAFFYFCNPHSNLSSSFSGWIQGFWMNLKWGPAVIGLLIGYGLLARFFNRTEILVTDSDVEISIRPIPFWRSKTISKSYISQMCVREKITDSSTDDRGPTRATKSYELSWVDPQNNRHSLVKGLLSNEALYLEARLGKILGIKKQVVEGAYSG